MSNLIEKVPGRLKKKTELELFCNDRYGFRQNWHVTVFLLHLSFVDLVYSIFGPPLQVIYYLSRLVGQKLEL